MYNFTEAVHIISETYNNVNKTLNVIEKIICVENC